jgi:hypothetical protein
MKASSTQLLFVMFCLCIVAPAVHAQGDEPVQSVIFKDNSLLATVNGKTLIFTNAINFPGGIKVMTNGVFTVKGGKERPLGQGQVLSADGMLTSPDGSVVPVQDHIASLGGKVFLVKDGEVSPLTRETLLADKTRVRPDGTVVTPDGKLHRLLDGQRLKLDGTGLPATDTVRLKDGKVILFKDGGEITLRPTQVMMMSEGTRVLGNGTIIYPDGKKRILVEGELLKLPGVIPPK